VGIGAEFNQDVDGTIDRLQNQLETSVERTVNLHRTGGNEEAVLAETAVAVGAAKALEILTGESWETQMERREDGAESAPAGKKPEGRRRRNTATPK